VWRYLKSAFLVSVDVPSLGRVPVNVLLASGFAILGIAQPAFWLVGAAVEAAIVPSLAFNPRFQKYVESQRVQAAGNDAEAQRRALIQILPRDSQKRLADLAANCERVLDVYRSQQAEDFIVDNSRDALKSLQWVYLKLLVAQHHLQDPSSHDSVTDLKDKIRTLEAQIKDPDESDSLRQSKTATLTILKKRLENSGKREQSLEEIDSDLTRIEAQVDLILENATMQGKPQTISSDIELASDLLGAGVFGDDESAISAIDHDFKKTAVKAQKETT
jgi:hypothetical protein